MTQGELVEVPAVLVCDCGNTSIRIACIVGEEVSDYSHFDIQNTDWLKKTLKLIISNASGPLVTVACSVNPDGLEKFQQAVSEIMSQQVLVVGRDIPMPMPIKTTNPQSVGTDRLCAAVAAYDRLGSACVVADFGSAATIDCVDDEGAFLGGAIMPGLAMSARALGQYTAALPTVDLIEPEGIFGTTTEEAIRNGIINGARGALRAIVEAYAEKLNIWPLVVLTGGDAKLLCPDIQEDGIVQAVVEDLTLRGVAMAYYNSLLE